MDAEGALWTGRAGVSHSLPEPTWRRERAETVHDE